MKNTSANANMASSDHRLTTASQGKKISMLTLVALFLCSLTISASAQKKVKTPAPMVVITTGTTQVWAVDHYGSPYQYNSKTNALDYVGGGSYGVLSAGKGNSLWARTLLTRAIAQYNFKTKAWVGVPGTLDSIGAGSEGVWGVNSASGHVYVYNPSTKSFDSPPHGQPSAFFVGISVGDFKTGPWALDNFGNAWLYNTNTDYFDETGGATLNQIAVGTESVWGINSSQEVFEYDVLAQKWYQPQSGARLLQITVGNNSNVWGISSSGELWWFNQSTLAFEKQTEPEKLWEISASGGSAGVFAIGNSGTVYKYNNK